jgi:cytidine deaminase
VETERGVFVGCNVENASYSLGVCAERVAIHTALAAGARRLTRLAVSCIQAQSTAPPGARMPCGACRQVIAEFMPADAEIAVEGAGVWRVDELLPLPFRLDEPGAKLPEGAAAPATEEL